MRVYLFLIYIKWIFHQEYSLRRYTNEAAREIILAIFQAGSTLQARGQLIFFKAVK